MNEMLGSELVELFKKGLEWSKVKEGETVLIYTDPDLTYPEYVPAVYAAARLLGAEAYVLTGPHRAVTGRDKFILDAWKGADMVVNLVQPALHLYTHEHNEVLRSGTRVLAIWQRPSTLRSLFPNQKVIDRCYAGAKRLQAAKEVRVTSQAGTDLVMRKDGRKGAVQIGVADAPGIWDQLGSALVSTAPLENATEGTYVIAPGDILCQMHWHVRSPITLTFRNGIATDVQGGADAMFLRDYVDPQGSNIRVGASSRSSEAPVDPNVYRVAHVTWGAHEGADWLNPWKQDAESFYGEVLIALGNNIFDMPHPYRGMGGANDCKGHLDICCRNASVYLDGELILENGTFIPDELK